MAVTIFDKLDEVPESLREGAKEVDGKFHVDATALLTKHRELLATNVNLKKVSDKFAELGDNVDAKTIKQALQDMKSADEREAEIQRRVQTAVQEAAAEHGKKISIANEQVTQMRSALEERIIDADLSTAILAAEGDPFLVLPGVRGHVKTFNEKGKFVAKVVDAEGKPRLNSDGKPMTMAELVTDIKSNDTRFAKAFKAPEASGGGSSAAAGNGNSGAAQGTVTLTREQAKDNRQYRQALETVKNDASKIIVKD